MSNVKGWVIVGKNGNICYWTFKKTKKQCIDDYKDDWEVAWSFLKKAYGVNCVKATISTQ